ncbi:GAF domain-containing sensor histidine kinase [Devosia neptuniae]|jgi:signal transduction histidine kinase|uniref:GAF domain-containing sensor histidine kinase n=1 Tax=Devosia TaxID=46913 RepID=UPI0022AF18B1|nr:GAF domain-containing sensor histidine kinase [Devosia neptuniae]MCZ4347806.1 GAF domain-containing sensor histidine kinase [Devosia neptuniae]|tara:strand:+ start:4852 stop:6048 length:1197 start_codon:yes stop_codon:yes gene_type:complete
MSDVHDFQTDIDAVRRIPAIPSILNVVCEATGMGFAAVARVTEDRWITCEVLDNVHFGLTPGDELNVETTLCHQVRASRQEVVIDHVSEDADYCDHHTPRLYGLQSYISVPITLVDGSFFGTLCAIDSNPAKLKNPATIGMFRLFAELIAHHLDSDQQLNESRAALAEERMTTELREQFVAILGHDLRNPLSALEAGTRSLLKSPLDERSTQIVGLMRKSVSRMGALVEDMLDLARGRLGGGIQLQTATDEALHEVVAQVVDELRSAHPERQIVTTLGDVGKLSYDRIRMEQLVSNLLGNALTHGAVDQPITVTTRLIDNQLEMAVANGGEAIPPHLLDNLFKPFFRAQAQPGQQGLGLGLYIASQIAKAHGGTLGVTSDDDQTRFVFHMPIGPLVQA